MTKSKTARGNQVRPIMQIFNLVRDLISDAHELGRQEGRKEGRDEMRKEKDEPHKD